MYDDKFWISHCFHCCQTLRYIVICKPGQIFLLISPALNRIIRIQDNAERARIVERPVRHNTEEKVMQAFAYYQSGLKGRSTSDRHAGIGSRWRPLAAQIGVRVPYSHHIRIENGW